MSNVIELITADADWEPRTEMDFVLVRAHEALTRFAGDVSDEEDLARLCAAMEELIADFKAARTKGSRLTP